MRVGIMPNPSPIAAKISDLISLRFLWPSRKFALRLAALALCVSVAQAAPYDARSVLLRHRVEGIVFVEDAESGAVLADAETGSGRQEGILPLSTTKLLLEAIALERGVPADLDRLIAQGVDNDGRNLALALRHRFGSAAVLDDLSRLGFPACGARETPGCFSLSPETPDAEWASALSLGETDIRVAPAQLAGFLRIVARDGMGDHGRVLGVESARALRHAMIETVESGSAKSIAGLVPKGFAIGGKTGTGPAASHPYDGIFAGVWIAGEHRASFVVYIRHGGKGGALPAKIAVEIMRTMGGR